MAHDFDLIIYTPEISLTESKEWSPGSSYHSNTAALISIELFGTQESQCNLYI